MEEKKFVNGIYVKKVTGKFGEFFEFGVNIEKCLQRIDFPISKEKTQYAEHYERNLEKYQTYVIRTDKEDINDLKCYYSVNDICDGSFSIKIEGFEDLIHFGRNWTPEFVDVGIWFSNLIEENNKYSFRDDEIKYLINFFKFIETKPDVKFSTPIAFEFISKGCRKPYKVITLGE